MVWADLLAVSESLAYDSSHPYTKGEVSARHPFFLALCLDPSIKFSIAHLITTPAIKVQL